MNLVERYPPTLELAQAYSEHAPAMSLLPWVSRGIAYAEKSLAIRKRFGDLWGQGQSLHFYGVVLYTAARYEECISKCRDAIELLEKMGDPWEVNIARHQLAMSLYRRGDLRAAVNEAKRIHKSAMELGDAQAAGFSLDIWSRASNGRVPADLLKEQLDKGTDDVQIAAQLALAEGVRLLADNRPEEAIAVLLEAHRKVQRAGMRNLVVVALPSWLATAYRHLAERNASVSPAVKRAMFRPASKMAHKALRIARSFKSELPHALRESARCAAARGASRLARQFLDASIEEAERQTAQYEVVRTRLARARLANDHGWDDLAGDLPSAEEALRAMENQSDIP
jgi:two-component system sensor kinase